MKHYISNDAMDDAELQLITETYQDIRQAYLLKNSIFTAYSNNEYKFILDKKDMELVYVLLRRHIEEYKKLNRFYC